MTAPATETLEDFYAHVMYLTDCRNRGQHGVAWQCMDEAHRVKWRSYVQRALEAWREQERFLAMQRSNGNAKAFFVP